MRKDSPKLKAAYQELRDLIQKIENLESEESTEVEWKPGLLMDYMVITATTLINDDGENTTAVGFMTASDDVTPHYRLLGMIEFVRARLLKQVMED